MKTFGIGDFSYVNQMSTWRILGYSAREPKNGSIEVEFEYRDTLKIRENISFIRKFHYLTNEILANKILKGEQIDLSFSYVKNLNLQYIGNLTEKEMVFPSFDAEYACFDGETKFDDTVIGDGKISFKNAVFGNGDVSFFQTKFGNCHISFSNVDFQRGTVSFEKAIFGDGDLTFEDTIFGHGNAIFTGADFGKGDVHFGGTIFEIGQVNFNDTNFEVGHVYFNNTNFGEGDTIFNNAKFGTGKVIFEHTNFQTGIISFINTDFSLGETVFKETEFGRGALDFTSSVAEHILFENCQFNNHDKLRFKSVNNLNIIGCTINKTLKITGAKIMSLKDTINLGYIYCDWEKDQVAKAIRDNGDSIKEKGRQYSLLKRNYNKIGSYEFEDNAFVEYMKCRREQLGARWLKALDWLIYTIGAYGTRPGKVAITMLIVWFVFGVLFTILCGVGGILSNGISSSWIDGFYFSGVTFLTIGYGDMVPIHDVAKVLSPIEGMIGLFLMSYFTVSVVRKTLR